MKKLLQIFFLLFSWLTPYAGGAGVAPRVELSQQLGGQQSFTS